jgi:hypothetical protein
MVIGPKNTSVDTLMRSFYNEKVSASIDIINKVCEKLNFASNGVKTC